MGNVMTVTCRYWWRNWNAFCLFFIKVKGWGKHTALYNSSGLFAGVGVIIALGSRAW